MPTKRDMKFIQDIRREYYAMGFEDGIAFAEGRSSNPRTLDLRRSREYAVERPSPKRKLSAWNKYVKNKRNHITYRDGKLNLKKMAVAFRRKKRR